MTEKRYTIILGKNNEFKEITDHCRQDKNISVFQFIKQVEEQNRAFKKLKKENKELKAEINKWKDKYYIAEETVIYEYSTKIDEEIEELQKEVYGDIND